MKIRLLSALAGLAISFALPTFAQEQNTVDPEVRQQIEAVLMKFGEAFNRYDAAACADFFTQDGVEIIRTWSEGGLASGQQALEKRFASVFASTPRKLSHKLLQLYPVGNDVCAISQISVPPVDATGHYTVTVFVRDADEWKIRVSYVY
jgi:ketosteroid isomerase-like protein